MWTIVPPASPSPHSLVHMYKDLFPQHAAVAANTEQEEAQSGGMSLSDSSVKEKGEERVNIDVQARRVAATRAIIIENWSSSSLHVCVCSCHVSLRNLWLIAPDVA